MSNSDVKARAIASALGAGLAESITLPTDVVKVRLQVQDKLAARPYTGFADCLKRTAKEEGVAALWKGFCPALARQVSYTSLALVIFEPIRDRYKALFGVPPEASPNFLQRLLAGGTAGGLAISVFNPIEVVKTQVQTHKGPEGLSMRTVISKVYSSQGILGFWAGVKPNVARTFLVNAAELGTYDEAKSRIQPILGEGVFTHVAASGCAGFTSACISTPADVIKTRLMNSAGGAQQYSGMFDAGRSILTDEGPAALYKGFLPICLRKLIWCAAFFVSYEQIRAACNK